MKSEFSAWKEGFRFYFPPLVLGVLLIGIIPWWWWTPPLLCSLMIMAFFRDPPRSAAAQPKELVAPADGTVTGVEELAETPHYNGPCVRLSIFLSILNAHVNRSPVDGAVTEVTYKPGEFLNAMNPASSERNEAATIRMQCEYGPVTVRQIAGLIARRIVCRAEVGDTLAKGQKFGMIRFGSRTELYMPPGTDVLVNVGDKIKAGLNVVARFP